MFLGGMMESESVRMEGQLMRSLLGDDDMMMLEAFMGTGVYGGNPFQQQNNNSSVVAATAAAAPATRQEEQDLVEIGGETALQQMLQSLVDNRPENWTYVIFWQLSSTATGDMMWVVLPFTSPLSLHAPLSLPPPPTHLPSPFCTIT
jgi:hypothetical protein